MDALETLAIILVLVWLWYWGIPFISANFGVDRVVRNILHQVDTGMDSEDTSLASCQARAIEHARVKLGALSESAANRIIVSEVIRKHMLDDMGMRPSHVSKYYPVAVAVYFIPTSGDILAYDVHRTARAKIRKWRAPRETLSH